MQELFYKIIYKTEQQNWWYRARRIIIKQLIKKYIQKIRPKILDVGCGTGLLFKELQQYADVYGIDSSPSSINFCVKRGLSNIKLGDATAIPHDDNFFDIVLALDLLEHIKDDNLAIQEIKRVVRKEGIIIIFVPAFKFLWGITDEISSHYRRYRKKDFVNLAKGNNLEILRFSYFNFFLFAPIALTRLFIRFFSIKINSENDLKFNFINNILYIIFLFESFLLKYINFPFGVSMLLVCKK